MDRVREIPKQVWLGIGAAIIAALIVFLPTVQYSFVNYDDPEIAQKNDDVLTFNLRNILLTQSAYDYIPLTLITFAVENKLFGLDPFWFHLNNVILHLFNIFLLGVLLYRLFPNKPMVIFFTLFVFSVHPLQVESVAWITQRKNVLYVLFYLLAMLAYLDKRPILVGIFFLLSIFSKATAITLPFVLLLLDYLKTGKLTKSDIKSKIPLFLLSVTTAIIHLQMHGTDVHLKKTYTLGHIFMNFGSSLTFYISKIIMPVNLAAYYQRGVAELTMLDFSLLGIMGVAILVFLRCSPLQRRHIAFGLGLFFITIGPTLQLVPFGNYFIYADRYVYFPIVGIAILAAFAVDEIRKNDLRQLAMISLFLVSGLMLAASFDRQAVWRNSVVLWEDQIEKYPRTDLAYFNLGGAYMFERNEPAKSIPYYQKTLEIDPTYVEAVFNWGLALNALAREDEAMAKFQEVIRLAPSVGKAYLNAGILYERSGRLEEAIRFFKKGAELEPKIGKAWELLASAYEKKGNTVEALDARQKASAP